MTRMTPQTLAVADFAPMLDLWAKQTEFAVYLQQQTLKTMMAPMAFFTALPGSTLPVAEPVAAPEPVAETAPEPVAETAPEPVAETAPEPVVDTAPEPVVETAPEPVVETAPEPVAETAPEPTSVEPVKSVAPGQPVLLDAPRGEADDLTALKGVGPKLAGALNEVGIWHLDQLSDLTEPQARWLDENVPGVRGKATRDNWASQAKTLMES